MVSDKRFNVIALYSSLSQSQDLFESFKVNLKAKSWVGSVKIIFP